VDTLYYTTKIRFTTPQKNRPAPAFVGERKKEGKDNGQLIFFYLPCGLSVSPLPPFLSHRCVSKSFRVSVRLCTRRVFAKHPHTACDDGSSPPHFLIFIFILSYFYFYLIFIDFY